MYYRISKNEKILFFGKKIAQVWAVTLKGGSMKKCNIHYIGGDYICFQMSLSVAQ